MARHGRSFPIKPHTNYQGRTGIYFNRSLSTVLTEASTSTDTLSHVATFTRLFTEAATLTASFFKTTGRLFAEAFSLADTFTKGFNLAAGPNSPGTVADDSTIGSAVWSNPGNAKVSDATYATATMSATPTDYLKATNFGFSIPSGATITGIKVEIQKKEDGSVFDNEVKIVKADGSIGTTDKSDVSEWPTSEGYTVYGGASDLWGETWTPTDINDADFGAVISATT